MKFKQTGATEYAQDGSIKVSAMVPAVQGSARRLLIHINNVDFVSPIDGSHIRNSRQLADHNKRHGVSNDLDSLREQTAKAKPQEFSVKKRKDDINDAIERASSSGFSRRVRYE